MKVFIQFKHGIGDCITFNSVLQQVRQHNPSWHITVQVEKNKEQCLSEVADHVFYDNDYKPFGFDKVIDVGYWEAYRSYEDRPSTKAGKCLVDDFQIVPTPTTAKITVPQEVYDRVDAYVVTLPARPAVLHYEGNTGPDKKNLTHDQAKSICDQLIADGFAPVILDWDERSPLPDNINIFCPDRDNPLWTNKMGDVHTIKALIERAGIFVGIDSGPGKIALLTETKQIHIWTGFHPLHYVDHWERRDEVLHLVPPHHLDLIRGDSQVGAKYFADHYNYKVYGHLAISACESIQEMLGKFVKREFCVGIPTLNRYDYLIQNIDHIKKSTLKPKRVVIVDNGGKFNRKALPDCPFKVDVITPEQNLGVATSWNLLRKVTKPCEIIIINDDVLVAPDVFEKMMMTPGLLVVPTERDFGCFLARNELWELLGGFDEGFKTAYCEDNDFKYRAALMNIEPTQIELKIGGGVSSTLAATEGEEHRKLRAGIDRNHQHYVSKWGGLPHSEKWTTPFNSPSTTDPVGLNYFIACSRHSDIVEHCPTLYEYSKQCEHITQWSGNSAATSSFLYAKPKTLVLIAASMDGLSRPAETQVRESQTVEDTDLLFLDGTHTENVVWKQLAYADRVRKFIILHDTEIFGVNGEHGERGIMFAVERFLTERTDWKVRFKTDKNNGLTILEKHG